MSFETCHCNHGGSEAILPLAEDNLDPLLRAIIVLIERDAVDDLIAVAEGITVRCPELPSDGAGEQ